MGAEPTGINLGTLGEVDTIAIPGIEGGGDKPKRTRAPRGRNAAAAKDGAEGGTVAAEGGSPPLVVASPPLTPGAGGKSRKELAAEKAYADARVKGTRSAASVTRLANVLAILLVGPAGAMRADEREAIIEPLAGILARNAKMADAVESLSDPVGLIIAVGGWGKRVYNVATAPAPRPLSLAEREAFAQPQPAEPAATEPAPDLYAQARAIAEAFGANEEEVNGMLSFAQSFGLPGPLDS